MTLASDQQIDDNALPEFSQQLLALRDDILRIWESKVMSQVQAAATLRHPILLDTFPTLFDNLVEALTPGYPRALATAGTTIATAHGGERARMTRYQPHDLITEYQLLRESIFEQLIAAKVQLPGAALMTINLSFDRAIVESITEFSIVHIQMREFFIAALSHDMRTPLSTASVATQLASRKIDDPSVKELLRTVLKSIARIDGMIGELLDDLATGSDSMGTALQLTSFDMLDLAREVCEGEHFGIGHFQVSGAPSPGYWCRDALKRALENLVGNAIKYGDGARPVRVHLARIDGRQLLSVHNEGPSIPRDKQERIFTPFYRDNHQQGQGQGWGVGLPFVRSVAQAHGGSVAVDSADGRGTTFTIDIPVDARPYQPAPRQRGEAAPDDRVSDT